MGPSITRALPLAASLTFLLACGGGGGGSSTPPPTSTAPTLTSVSPTHASPGMAVTLTGTNLTGARAVSFNGRAAFSFTAVSATQVNAVVPSGATTGPITVTATAGAATSSTFTVDAALAPTLASFSPASLTGGSVVTLTGTHFVGASQVRFNGVDAASFTVASDTSIQATAPAGLTAGAISVTTPGGTATSNTSYTVDSSIQALLNGGFETSAPLAWAGDTGVIQPAPGASYPGIVPFSGSKFAWLGGYGAVQSDQVTQDVYIPATAQSATATFQLKIVTAEAGATAPDTLTVQALDTSNAVLGTLLSKSNQDASNYTSYSVDLLPHKGRIVRLSFKSAEDAQNATSFLLDEVEVNLVTPAASDLAPVISSFTPTSGVAGEVTVQITGGNFFGLTGVTLGGVSATPTLTDGTRLSVALPATAAAGSAPITMTNAQGTGTSSSNFSVTYGIPAIVAMHPTAGPVGTPVVITGAYLGYPGTTLTLNGQAVTGFTQSATQITFTVPAGGTTGPLVVTTPGGSASSAFTVNTASTTMDLHVDKVQLIQSTQTLTNAVPVVAGKDGLVRAFVLANQANTAVPAVRITLMNNGVAVAGYPKTVTSSLAAVPTALAEDTLGASWNLAIPAADLTTPTGSGYSVLAEVDPAGAVAEADESNNATTATLAGLAVPTFKTTIFPVVLSGGTGNITEANKAEWVGRLAKMFPVGSVEVTVGAAFTPSVSTLADDGTNWDTVLQDLATKHQADGTSDRYYYGALKVSYSSGVAGLGYVPNAPSNAFYYRTAIGWDKTGYSDGGNFPEVFAHETGHNMGRPHSPCGGVASSDPAYPYSGGLIGIWGYDSVLNQLKSPATHKDIMGYCTPNWISDYVYNKILAFRDPAAGGFLTVGAEDAPLPKQLATPKECLIVRGIVREDGSVDLRSSFRTRALPSALPGAGEFDLECLNDQGVPVFKTALDLMEVGCSPKGHDRHFVMALPLEAAALDAIAELKVLKDGRPVAGKRALSRTARLVAAAPEARRLSKEKVQITWDAMLHPTAMVRDADTGEVVAILEGGRQAIATAARHLEVVLSDGVTGSTKRLDIAE